MKTLIILTCTFILLLANDVLANDSTDDSHDIKYTALNIIGVFGIIPAYSKSIDYLEIRDQICFDIKDFPILPFFETAIDVGINNQKPKLFYSILFGMKANFLKRNDFILSVNVGSGIAGGIKDNDNAGVIAIVGLDFAYKNIVLRLAEINLMSGFAFNGTASFGISYIF